MRNIPSWNPGPDSGITIQWIETNGQTFEVAQAGEGKKLALCLHGFPELHYSWRFQIPLLVEQGYRVYRLQVITNLAPVLHANASISRREFFNQRPNRATVGSYPAQCETEYIAASRQGRQSVPPTNNPSRCRVWFDLCHRN